MSKEENLAPPAPPSYRSMPVCEFCKKTNVRAFTAIWRDEHGNEIGDAEFVGGECPNCGRTIIVDGPKNETLRIPVALVKEWGEIVCGIRFMSIRWTGNIVDWKY